LRISDCGFQSAINPQSAFLNPQSASAFFFQRHSAPMTRLTAIYLNAEGVRFDGDYYRRHHLPLAERLMKPLGLLWIEGDSPLPRKDGTPSTLIAQTHAYFRTPDEARAAVRATMRELAADVPNYSSVTPTLELHDIHRID
jgi:uncharacterized protein (TIGR02118 family)